MIKHNDIVGYIKENDFRSVVLEDVLKMFCKKSGVEVVKLPAHSRSQIDVASKSTLSDFSAKNKINGKENFCNNRKLSEESCGTPILSNQSRAQRGRLKIALPSTTDSTSYFVVNRLINHKAEDLTELNPVNKKMLKPLYLFLDKEVLLYAKLKKLKYKKKKDNQDKISKFINELEKKHPEIKNAIISSLLKLYYSSGSCSAQ